MLIRSALALVLFAAGSAAAAETVYVSNERGNSISVIDPATNQVTATWPVGRRARGILVSRDGRQLYLTASEDNAIQVIDRKTGAVLHDLPAGDTPEQIALAPDGRTIYTSNERDNVLTAIDAAGRRIAWQLPTGVEPEGVAVSPDNRFVVVTSETDNKVHWIDIAAKREIDATPVGERPRHAEFTADGLKLWVTGEVGGNLTIIDVRTRKAEKTVAFAPPGVSPEKILPVGIRFTPDGAEALVVLGRANQVAFMNARTGEVTGYVPAGQRIWHLAIDAAGKRAYTTDGVSDTVSVIDIPARRLVASIPVGRAPWGVTIAP